MNEMGQTRAADERSGPNGRAGLPRSAGEKDPAGERIATGEKNPPGERIATGEGGLRARVFRALEVPALVAVPVALAGFAAAGMRATAGLTLMVCALAVCLVLASFEASRPALRQLMPTAVLAALAAAGRVLFAPLPDVKPVSAIAIVAGAALGRRSGFVVGALAALLSNFFFGQGPWTPWQMYAWGLVGYVGGVLGERRARGRGPLAGAKGGDARDSLPRALWAWAALSGPVYGLILNGYHVLGYVQPLTWPAVVAACAASVPLDVVHGAATVAFLAAVWGPWGRAIRRAVAKYDL